jgi:hypothetical protein
MQIQGGGSYAFFKVNIRPTLVQTLRFPTIVFFGGLGYCRLRVLTECVVLTSVIQLENYVSTTLSPSRRLGILIDTL